MSRHRKQQTGFLSRPRSTVAIADDGDELYDERPAEDDLSVVDAPGDNEPVGEATPAAEVAVVEAPARAQASVPLQPSPYISMGFAPHPQQNIEYPPVPQVAMSGPKLPVVAVPEQTPSAVIVQPVLEPVVEPVLETVVEAVAEPVVVDPEPATVVLPAPTIAFVPPSIDVAPAPAAFEPPVPSVAGAVAYEPPPVDIEGATAAADPQSHVDVEAVTTAPDAPPAADPVAGVGADVEEAGSPQGLVRTTALYAPVVAPDRRTRRSEERGSRRRKRLIIGVAGFVTASVAVAGTLYFVNDKRAAVPPSTATVAAATQVTGLVMLAGAKSDMVAGALISVDQTTGTSHVVLIPSKVIASIPGHGTQQLARVTQFDRSTAPIAAVSDLFGVRVDSSVVLDPAALAGLIDNAGGITVETVDVDVRASVGGRDTVVVPAGTHVKLNGGQAVAYASYLVDSQEEEIARIVRFQLVMDAVVATLPDGAAEVLNRLSALGGGVVFGGKKAALGDALTGFHKSSVANSVAEDSLPTRSIDSGGDEQIYGVDSSKMADLIAKDFSGSTLKRRAGGLDRVLVENGVGTPGLGECVRNQLVGAGFDFKGSSNLPGFTYRDKPSLVLIYDEQPANIEAGQAVATALKLPATAVSVSTEPQNIADVVVVLGKDYACG